jgi:hypothetical protein
VQCIKAQAKQRASYIFSALKEPLVKERSKMGKTAELDSVPGGTTVIFILSVATTCSMIGGQRMKHNNPKGLI